MIICSKFIVFAQNAKKIDVHLQLVKISCFFGILINATAVNGKIFLVDSRENGAYLLKRLVKTDIWLENFFPIINIYRQFGKQNNKKSLAR